MQDNNSSSRLERESLKRLEQAFSELNRCNQNNLIDFTSKFCTYYKLFKDIFPECVKGYNLKPCGPNSS